MVSTANAQTVLDQVRDYYRQRYTQNITLLPSTIQTDDIIYTGTPNQSHILASVQKMNMNLTGGYLAKTDILGVQAIDYRQPRTGIAVCGADLTRQNAFRRYQYAI
jgi:hypothetical protein